MLTLKHLLADPLLYVLGAVLGLGSLYIRRLIEKGVDHRFEERLQDHKHSLEVATEQARFEFQRQLADFNLYAVKRHNAAETIYAAVRVAHGHVVNLFGLARGLTFQEYDEKDIAAYMAAKEVPSGKQVEIRALWSSDRTAAVKLLRPYLRMLDVQEAERKLNEAKNLTYLNELYLSDGAIEALNNLYEILIEWLSHAEFPTEAGERWRPDRKAVNERLESVHELLRSELSSGVVGHRTATASITQRVPNPRMQPTSASLQSDGARHPPMAGGGT